MDLLSPQYLLTVLLVFVRISGLLVAAPFFSHQTIAVQIKVLLSVLLAYTMAGFVPHPPPAYVADTVGFFLALGVEAVTGLLLGFTAQFIFWALEFAGEIMGFQMGLSMAQIYNPISNTSTNPLGRFISLSFLIIFLLLDGHHLLLQTLVHSFELVPLAGANLQAGGPLLLEWMGSFFVNALRLAAPFMVTIFLIDIALGIFARVVPQANLFSLSLPLKLLSGLGILYFFVQYFFPIAPQLIDQMHRHLRSIIEAMAT